MCLFPKSATIPFDRLEGALLSVIRMDTFRHLELEEYFMYQEFYQGRR